MLINRAVQHITVDIDVDKENSTLLIEQYNITVDIDVGKENINTVDIDVDK